LLHDGEEGDVPFIITHKRTDERKGKKQNHHQSWIKMITRGKVRRTDHQRTTHTT
jgi:hypothetical protein